LVSDGYEVVGFDDLSAGSLENLLDAPEVDLIVGDLRDEAAVAHAARGCEVIYHLGAVRSVPRSIVEPGLTTDVNVRGTLNVLTSAHEVGARVVFASSSSVYGDQDVYPLHEGLTPGPRSPYAASKLAGEAYCMAWWQSLGVPTVALRYFNVYGPHQDPASQYAVVVPLFVAACLSGTRPIIHGTGEQARDFTYVDDAVDATVRAAHAGHDAWGHAFNVGGGQTPTSIKVLLAKIAALTSAEPIPEYQPSREGDVRLTHADLSRSREVLGYEPKVEIDEGLARVVRWFAQTPLSKSVLKV
jgi:nucleoside-diphosphate-sugar epimerase